MLEAPRGFQLLKIANFMGKCVLHIRLRRETRVHEALIKICLSAVAPQLRFRLLSLPLPLSSSPLRRSFHELKTRVGETEYACVYVCMTERGTRERERERREEHLRMAATFARFPTASAINNHLAYLIAASHSRASTLNLVKLSRTF